jgi:alpha-glucosidase
MNYDAFMEPVTWFFTGLEKHSNYKRDDLYQNGERFFEMMRDNMSDYQWNSLLCAMNELSNHDHSRFLTRTNRKTGTLKENGTKAAGVGVDIAVLREAVAVQMTWPGAPTIYYGDEAGLVGWTDPDNRRTYPWGQEDKDLIQFHKDIIKLRKKHPVLRRGSFKPMGSGDGWIAFARFDKKDRVVTVSNTGKKPVSLILRVRDLGADEGEFFIQSFITTPKGYSFEEKECGLVEHGELRLKMKPRSTVILTRRMRIFE